MSKLWHLYNLYGFDLFLNLVVHDSMHILLLCLFKMCVANLKEVYHGQGPKLNITLREVKKTNHEISRDDNRFTLIIT